MIWMTFQNILPGATNIQTNTNKYKLGKAGCIQLNSVELRSSWPRAKITSPNPWVGAVVVADGQVIGQGFHK
jgi:hypothetical protein